MIAHLANETVGRRGLMFVLSSPSGAGKTTLTRLLREQEPSLSLSISVTTRERRASEVDGVHYHFIAEDEFHAMKARGDLLESAEVHGNHYGSPRKQVEKALEAGQDILFDIDYQGTQQLVANAPDDVVSVFILPPSMAELRLRLERRAEDSQSVIEKRLANAKKEIRRWTDYSYVLVNDDLDRTFSRLRLILAAERLKRERQTGLETFVNGLIAEKV
jgi:guanylate kinase